MCIAYKTVSYTCIKKDFNRWNSRLNLILEFQVLKDLKQKNPKCSTYEYEY